MAALLVATWSFAAVSCGNDDERPVLRVGADSSAESIVLAEIYSQALARTGTRTDVRTGLDTPVTDLDAGHISVLPARNGELVQRWNPGSAARAPAEVAAAVNAALPQGLSVSDAADGADVRARLLVTEGFAEGEQVRAVDELDCASLHAGVVEAPGFAETGPARIEGCSFAAQTRFTDVDGLRKALQDGIIQVGVVNGPPPVAAGLIVLDDQDYALRAQNVLALFRAGIFDRVEMKKLNYVAGELTTDGLVELIDRVEGGAEPADAARAWLDAHGL
ncbi:glycine betaine ABC transporter substrate-binding protein [Nocardia halotolerans]|uniref:Glycine betaine ABC transporter substrate-binding protein n=1 Tax=Nocardia halotolerans TaxID=1755878 RepID=A0ABV8VLE4_9NOCA